MAVIERDIDIVRCNIHFRCLPWIVGLSQSLKPCIPTKKKFYRGVVTPTWCEARPAPWPGTPGARQQEYLGWVRRWHQSPDQAHARIWRFGAPLEEWLLKSEMVVDIKSDVFWKKIWAAFCPSQSLLRVGTCDICQTMRKRIRWYVALREAFAM